MNYSTLAIYFKIKAEWFNCSINYSTFMWHFHPFHFLVFLRGFLPVFSTSRFPGTWKLVYCLLWNGDVAVIHPYYLFSNSALPCGAVTVDTGELCIHKSKEMLCFVLCLFASNSQLCICWEDATEHGEEKPHNQYVVAPMPGWNTVIQNKCFPNLWKHDYTWLICLCATFSGLNPSMAVTRCAEFHDCWLQLRSCWEGDRG